MSHSLIVSEFTAWMEAYKTAWEDRDPGRAAALFTSDGIYHEMPFDAPVEGEDSIAVYWTKAVSGQTDIRFTYEILACNGAEGIAHWHCAFTGVPGGEKIDLDGIFRCRFRDAGLVEHFREWWHVQVVPAS